MDRYTEFCNRYGIKELRYSRDYDSYRYNRLASDYEGILELEIPRRGLEYLVQVDSEHIHMRQNERDEMYMRKQYPALKDAYEKYRMLLALYK